MRVLLHALEEEEIERSPVFFLVQRAQLLHVVVLQVEVEYHVILLDPFGVLTFRYDGYVSLHQVAQEYLPGGFAVFFRDFFHGGIL